MNGDCSDNYTCQEVMNHFILFCWSYFKTKNLALILFLFWHVSKKLQHIFLDQGLKQTHRKM